jgi:uncharacterized protein involved in propanediol utilization
MERGKSRGFANSMADVVAVAVAAVAGVGSTKAIEETKARSVSWQQDMPQSIIPAMS